MAVWLKRWGVLITAAIALTCTFVPIGIAWTGDVVKRIGALERTTPVALDSRLASIEGNQVVQAEKTRLNVEAIEKLANAMQIMNTSVTRISTVMEFLSPLPKRQPTMRAGMANP